ncbi:MAG: DNA repair protein RecO [Eubacteriales bacterium]|nr:DNA repair protein RecO [Eubacteriales bacterium]
MSDRLELTGMVLASTPIGEYDRRVVLLTRERGKISAFAKGARRQSSPLMGAVKPFTFGTFECFEGRSSYNIYRASVNSYFEELSTDFEGTCYGMYFLEFADYYTRENNDEREMLNLLYVALNALQKKTMPAELIRRVYELRAMVIGGEYPECFCCVNCGSTEQLAGYSDRKKGTVCESCLSETHAKKLQESTIYTLQYVIGSPLTKLFHFQVSETVHAEFTEIVEEFQKSVLDREFKSLETLRAILEFSVENTKQS